MKKRLDALRKKDKRLIVGVETGGDLGTVGAALVEVSGSGDETVLSLRGFASVPLHAELRTALKALEADEQFDSEELAGINFLVLNHLSKLFDDVTETAGVAPDKVDCIGLSCLEIGGLVFPADPGVLSEMTDAIVASHFRIGVENGDGHLLDVDEPLLQGIVNEMIDRFGLDEEVREAVTVALLTNESIFSEGMKACMGGAGGGRSKGRKSIKAVKRSTLGASERKATLCGEFFFPF